MANEFMINGSGETISEADKRLSKETDWVALIDNKPESIPESWKELVIIASEIEGNEDVFVYLESEDCIGKRTVVAYVCIEKENSGQPTSIARKVKDSLKSNGYSVSVDVGGLFQHNGYTACKFRTSEKPI